MSQFDSTVRFLFDQTPIRGELTQLDRSLQDVLEKHNYPKPVQRLLGEFLAASAMLSDTIKFDGTLSLHVRGAGQVRTLMAECRDNRALRAVAQYNDDYDPDGPALGEGQMAITIEPKVGKRYQGLVAINDADLTLARVLEDYFVQSEQIRTRVWLFTDCKRAAGFMLQAMPTSASSSSLDHNDEDDSWGRCVHLAETLSSEEVLSLDAETVLHRLFHEETVRVYPPRPLQFECTCSEKRSANAIVTLGIEEALAACSEQGLLEINCQFCHAHYAFTTEKVQALFRTTDEPLN